MSQVGKRKIYNEFMERIYIFVIWITYFIFIIGYFSNIYIIVDLKYYRLSILPYFVFAISEIIFVISLSISRFTTKKENKMPRID